MVSKLDHIVIGAASLEQGCSYIREQLGIYIPKGGEHPLMGTHNHLMQLGNNTFLEVIAINPNAELPTRPRWFGLDDPAVRRSLSDQPRLLTWVINTSDLVEMQAQVSVDIGVITPLSRGELNWLFAVPDDGRLLSGGMLPNVMQWQTDTHPSANMANLNCSLRKINLYHPYPQWISSALDEMKASTLATVHPLTDDSTAYMTVELECPNGVVELSSVVVD